MDSCTFTRLKTGPYRSRRGVIKTPNGIVQTPAFIFCATKGSLKSLTMDQVHTTNAQIILSNTYHLMINPGADHIRAMGGLHKFMNWNGPLFTDSGGFQIFSLGHGSVSSEIKGSRQQIVKKTLLKVTEEGAIFRSYINGQRYNLTPETSISTQVGLGADLIVVLDECTPFHLTEHETAQSMRRSHRWAQRSLDAFSKEDSSRQGLYGIIQGGIWPHLRNESTDFVNSLPFFGHAIGGSLGASKSQMYEIVDHTSQRLSLERPIHLLGIGGVEDIFYGVRYGIDTFDCVHPTRIARHGGALVPPSLNPSWGFPRAKDHINLRNACYAQDTSPIDPGCSCTTCASVSRAYLHYLLKSKELSAFPYITIHNMSFMVSLMTAIRKSIDNNTFSKLAAEWVPTWKGSQKSEALN